jgi:hypothetical protein
MSLHARPIEVDVVLELLDQQRSAANPTTMNIHQAEVLLDYIGELEQTVVHLKAAVVNADHGETKKSRNYSESRIIQHE